MRGLSLVLVIAALPAPASAQMAMMGGALGATPMTQDASGTAWQPASTPMQGLMWSSGDWTGMVHGVANLVADHQSGPRGDDAVFSNSMIMGMAQHGAGAGTLTVRSMLSLDPAMGPWGYPLLLQTGETANGSTALVDRQHPHNLVMEMAAVYAMPAGAGSSLFVYFGYPGEPALGPATFMHRLSGEDSPAAPISHHWLDSTHVTFGVVTAGWVHGPLKLELSAFNGREPDQHRWGYQPLRLDSASARITLNPARDWSLQVSYGALNSPEQLTPGVNQRRLTASATWNHRLGAIDWQTTLAWGHNRDLPGNTLNALLAESALVRGDDTLFARAEWVQKDDLAPGTAAITPVGAVTLGYVHDFALAPHLAFGLGGQATLNHVPAALASAYGSASPTGTMLFARIKIR
jgi:cyclophilin family peptidyl-prolyl cis-trans isomerase